MPRSIIDIDVKDDAFKAFKALFDEYRAHLDEMPNGWEKVAVAIKGSIKAEKAIADQIKEEAKSRLAITQAFGRHIEQQKQILNLERKRREEVHLMWQDSVKIAQNIASTTVDLFKWAGLGGIIGGLVGAGGLWGITALAQGASNTQRFSRGVGVDPNQQQALNINYSRYLDVNSDLSQLAAAKSDLSAGWAFNAVGVSRNQDPAALLVQLAKKGAELYQGGHTLAQDPMVRAMAVLGITLEDMRRLAKAGKKELDTAETGYRNDAASLGLTPDEYNAQAEFAVQMARASAKIKAVFIDLLQPIEPELKDLSAAVVDMIKGLENNGEVQKWIRELGDGIKWLGHEIGTKEFRDGMGEFITDIGLVAAKVVDALVYLNLIPKPGTHAAAGPPGSATPAAGPPGSATPFQRSAVGRAAALLDPRGGFWGNINMAIAPDANMAMAHRLWKYKHRLDAAPAELGFLPLGAQAALWAEGGGGFDPEAKNPFSTAYGQAQWTQRSGRQDLFRRIMGVDIHNSTEAQQADFIRWELKNTSYGRKAVIDMAAAVGDEAKARAFIHDFEIPGAFAEETDMGAARYYLSKQKSSGHVTVSVDARVVVPPGHSAPTQARAMVQ